MTSSPLGVADDVDADVGGDGRTPRSTRALSCSSGPTAATRPRARPDQRQQPALERALVQLDVAAELVAPDHVEQLLQRDPLGVEQQLVAEVEDPQVAEHLALVGEERGVAAVPGVERLDVVGHLAVQELLGLGTGQRELAALGAVDQARPARSAPGSRRRGCR